MYILIIEDDITSANYTQKGLIEAGHSVEIAETGYEGLKKAEIHDYDILIVDRMLPIIDGLTMISRLRGKNILTPALILSALGEVDDRVRGLKAGADDYLSKPFALSELLARLDVLHRRANTTPKQTVLTIGDLKMDLLSREVTRNEITIDLQPREFRLLEYLMRHHDQTVTRTMLLENVWDYHFDPQTNVIDVHISRLRGKIDKNFDFQLLSTVRGVGYILRAEEKA